VCLRQPENERPRLVRHAGPPPTRRARVTG
jgi:hypothetical protein